MAPARTFLVPLGLMLALTLGLAHEATRGYPNPFPPLSVSLSSPVAQLSDFAGIAAGFRKLTGDIAWIQTMIYYGTPEEGKDPELAENGGGQYPLFLPYCQRAAEIDPTFKYIYYYCGSALGWNLNRLDEAEVFLKEGIKANPKEWRFQQFLAAMAFQKSHNINSLVDFLNTFVQQPDCPNILRSILANIYKKQKRYMDSIRIWMILYDTGDPSYTQKAVREMHDLAQEAHLPGQNRP